MEEREWALEREALHLSQLQVAQKPLINQPCSGYLVDVPKMPEGHFLIYKHKHLSKVD